MLSLLSCYFDADAKLEGDFLDRVVSEIAVWVNIRERAGSRILKTSSGPNDDAVAVRHM
jgi:hypothetical protein